VAKVKQRTSGDVAIVGMSCLLPGAPDIRTFWQNIVDRKSALGEPPDDWGGMPWFDPASTDNDRIYCKRGGYLGDIATFDPIKYGVMPLSVDGAEPEHFLALRAAYDALLDAGVPDIALNKKRTEVILGRGTFVNRGYTSLHQHGLIIDQTLRLLKELHPEYSEADLREIKKSLKAGLPPFNAETAPGLVSTVMSGRIANRLDLMGANYCIDAACASSLIATEMGVKDLLSGKCDAALVGGVQMTTHHLVLMVFCQLGALSRSSQMLPFDKDADGTLLGEGIGMMVLKRREDAECDGNRIYAVIKGLGTASDGKAKSVVAPRLEGEELAIRRAYEDAGIEPGTIGLIEAHGTAIPLGDSTEIESLARVFGRHHTGESPIAIGTVKSMIGHLIPASGIAGLIKTALSLHHRVLPPTICNSANPKLGLEETPFYINTETRPWIHGVKDMPRRAGVNAFGFGGINAHAILEEYTGQAGGTSPESLPSESYQTEWDSELLIINGGSRSEIIEKCRKIEGFLSKVFAEPSQTAVNVTLKDLAYTLNTDGHGPCRLAIVATDIEDLASKLTRSIKRLEEPGRKKIRDKKGVYYFDEQLGRSGGLAFLFPGEGSQYENMLADLCMHFPEVRECFDTLDEAFAGDGKQGGHRPSSFIYPVPENSGGATASPASGDMWRMDVAVDAVINADRALFRLLGLLGISPEAVVGHSSGEFMSLEASGALVLEDKEELMRHIARGSKVIERISKAGNIPEASLLTVGAARPGHIGEILKRSKGRLITSMDNCPNQVVLCGDRETTEEAAKELHGAGAICQTLPFARPYHTAMYAPACDILRELFDDLKIVPPKIKVYSCKTAAPMPAEPDEIRELAIGQWAAEVRFRETVEAMYDDGIRLFLEVGPRSNLTGFTGDILKGREHISVSANVHFRSGTLQLHHCLGLLAAHGVEMDLEYLYRRRAPRRVDMDADVTGKEGAVIRKAPKIKLALPELTLGADFKRPERKAAVSGPTDPGAAGAGSSVDLAAYARIDAEGQTGGVRGRVDAGSSAMDEYLGTMEQFLDAQSEVMQEYFAGLGVAAGGGGQAQGIKNNAPFDLDEDKSLTSVAEVLTDQAEQSASQPAAGAFTDSAYKDTTGSLKETLLDIVSERTGYPPDMLGLDQNMEADLGIDSIKRTEILAALQEKVGAMDGEGLAGLKTLQEIIDRLDDDTDGPAEGGFRAKEDALPWPGQAAAPEVAGEAPQPGAGTAGVSPLQHKMPFIGRLLEHIPGQRLTALRDFDIKTDTFLLDHALGREVSTLDKELTGLPVMPLTVSMEILAEAAALLSPGMVLTAMKDVRAYRWIQFEEERLSLKVDAVRRASSEGPGQIYVQLWEVDGDGEKGLGKNIGLPIIEATMVFAGEYPEPPTARDFTLAGQRASTWRPDTLYSEGMFSGPAFRAMASVDLWGADGAEATLRTLPLNDLFSGPSDYDFVTDPVLLDAAGQLVAYWIAEHRDTGFNVYPFRVGEISFYGANLAPGQEVGCRARILPLAENQLRSDIDIILPGGRPYLRISAWDDRSFDLPPDFYRIRFRPTEVLLSRPRELAEGTAMAGAGNFECRVMEDYPDELLHSHGLVWQRVFAYLALGRRERELWRAMEGGSKKRRIEWLLGRVAAKDAVRLLLRKHHGLNLCLPDIEIGADKYNRPVAGGLWTDKVESVPLISITHTERCGVAIAVEKGLGCGIDLEFLGTKRSKIDKIVICDEEKALLDSYGPDEGDEGMEWPLRIWSAKEAVGKALGRGLPGGPNDLILSGLDKDNGKVCLRLSGKLGRELPEFAGFEFEAYTLRDGDFVVATAIHTGGEKQNDK